MSETHGNHPVLPNNQVSGILVTFWQSARIFTPLYTIGFFALFLSLPVSSLSGTRPDISTLSVFGSVLAMIFTGLIVLAILIKFIRMILFEKPDNPSWELVHWISNTITRENRPLNLLHMLISVSLLLVGFAVLKGAIAVLNPFSWDPTFVEWERWLHFGKLPHEWLSFIVNNHVAVVILNFFYNMWYFIMLATVLAAGIYVSRETYHIQYLISFMMVGLFGGFFVALIFSSAGPCFYERAGFGTEYVPLLQALNEASKFMPVWALQTQDLLWDGYIGKQSGSVGIAAFPSLHVANALLIALYCSKINRLLAIAAWIFAVLIFLGSIVLAWHYALDSYAGIVLALLAWKLAGKIQAHAGMAVSTSLAQ